MTAMYPVRVGSSVSKQTDEDLRDIAERIEVPMAVIIRQGIEEKVAALKEGLKVADSKAAREVDILVPAPGTDPVLTGALAHQLDLVQAVNKMFAPIFEDLQATLARSVASAIKVPSVAEFLPKNLGGMTREH